MAGYHLEPRPASLRAARNRPSRCDAALHHRRRQPAARPPKTTTSKAFGLAQVCGARVAVLPQVPNQPLLDGKTEDELIAETFVRYLQTKDENWPLLFPMVKSAVKRWMPCRRGPGRTASPWSRFVVTRAARSAAGRPGSTGAVDDRVIAIAPMVIVMLNLGPQGPNQLKVWGEYSEQIHDYVERGLMEKVATPAGTNLWKMVDPFTYEERLLKPKMLINGANDRYWTLNALDLYWNDLQGPKYLVELPNAGHDLKVNRDWATSGLGAFFHHVVLNRPMPQLTWDFADGPGGDYRFTIRANPAPQSARVWTARSGNRDFRESKWESAPLKPGETMSYQGQPAASGRVAMFGEVEYQVNGIPLHLTTTFFEPGVGEEVGSVAGRLPCTGKPALRLWIFVVLTGLACPASAGAQALEPIVYTVKIAKPDSHAAEVEAVFPTAGRSSVDLMMPSGRPGFIASKIMPDGSRISRRKQPTAPCSKSSIPKRTAGGSRPAASPRSPSVTG